MSSAAPATTTAGLTHEDERRPGHRPFDYCAINHKTPLYFPLTDYAARSRRFADLGRGFRAALRLLVDVPRFSLAYCAANPHLRHPFSPLQFLPMTPQYILYLLRRAFTIKETRHLHQRPRKRMLVGFATGILYVLGEEIFSTLVSSGASATMCTSVIGGKKSPAFRRQKPALLS